MPEVSVITGSHNSRKYLPATIASLLAQTEVDWEWVVVDNGSRDGSADLIRAQCPPERLRLVVETAALGSGGAMRRGVAEARAPLLAVLDADDVMRPQRLMHQRDFMKTRPELGLLAGRSQIIDGEGRPGIVEPAPNLPADIYGWSGFTHTLRHSTFMMRREVALAVPYRLEFNCVNDFDFITRVVEQFPAACLPDVLVDYRVHAESVSKTRRAEVAMRLALCQLITRRRRQGLTEDLATWFRRFEEEAVRDAGDQPARVHAGCARVLYRAGYDDLAAFHAWQSWRLGVTAAAPWWYLRAMGRGLSRSPQAWTTLVRAWMKEPAHVLLNRGGVPERIQF